MHKLSDCVSECLSANWSEIMAEFLFFNLDLFLVFVTKQDIFPY